MFRRGLGAISVAAVAALILTSCAQSQRDTPEGGATEGATSDATFTFGISGAPKVFDPFYASDGETFTVTDTMYEGLLSLSPGTVDVAPSLATEWEADESGTVWDFKLREGVKFHDGTEFNADAVCFNFERWFNQTGVAQSSGVSYSWINDFGGFADQPDVPTLYEGCEVNSEFEVTLKLTRPSSHMPAVLAYSSFAIASPTALEEYSADDVKADGDGFTWPAYATDHPTGTGPFTFAGFDTANGIVKLERNEDYWGDKAGVSDLVFKIISGESERRQELEAGSIDGYDLPNPVDWGDLEAQGHQVLIREAFNVMFVALNPLENDALLDLRVRQALLYAINQEQLVASQLPEGAYAASQLLPKAVTGHNPELSPYPFDTEKAKELLAEAGYADLTLEFWYPTEISRPYMPDPIRVFEAIRSDWEAAGINVVPISKPWGGGYIDGIYANRAPAFLLGGTDHYDSPDPFMGAYFGNTETFFQTGLYDWGQTLADDVRGADSEGDPELRLKKYQKIEQQLMQEYLPMLPIAHTPPALVVGSHVQGIVPSPVAHEDFSKVTLTN